MSTLRTTHAPAPIALAAPAVKASVNGSAAAEKSGPQSSVCVPRHLAIVPEAPAATRAEALRWLDALSHVIDGCAADEADGVEHVSVFVTGKQGGGEILLEALRAWLFGHAASLSRRGIFLDLLGEPDAATREAMRFAARAAQDHRAVQRLQIHLAVNYDGRAELAAAARMLAAESRLANVSAADTTDALQQCLASAALPPVDLLLRTGGQTRLTHFLLWQIAYAELLFAPTPWLTFSPDSLREALDDFARRRRTFGGLNKNSR